jgi:hypothetical protein
MCIDVLRTSCINFLFMNITYEFEFENSPICFGRFKCILNLWLLNGVGLLTLTDTIDSSLVLVVSVFSTLAKYRVVKIMHSSSDIRLGFPGILPDSRELGWLVLETVLRAVVASPVFTWLLSLLMWALMWRG